MPRAVLLALLALGGGALAAAAAAADAVAPSSSTARARPSPSAGGESGDAPSLALHGSDAAAAAMAGPLAALDFAVADGALSEEEEEHSARVGRALLQQQQPQRRGGGFFGLGRSPAAAPIASDDDDDRPAPPPPRRGPFGRPIAPRGPAAPAPAPPRNNAPPRPAPRPTAAAPPPPPAQPKPSSSPLYASPAPSWTAAVTLDPNTQYGDIPQSFMGISHEWPFVEELAARPEYVDLVRKMGSFGNGPPVIRIGGGSTDKLTSVPEQRVWDALNKLYREANVRYILGLPLEQMNGPLARAIYLKARKELPPEAILSFEIGNEPNFYGGGNEYVRCCFIPDWGKFVPQVACDDPTRGAVDSATGGVGSDVSSCELGVFAGPAWGHVNIRPLTLDWFLYSHGRWVDLATVHWYKATSQAYNTAETLMDEAPVRAEMANLRELVKIAAKHGKPLRVAEANTISNSGRDGVSNVFAAALWTLDASMEVAAAGGSGINFHQGAGQNLYTGILRWTAQGTGKLNPPIVKPPYYGYLAFGQAVGTGSRFIRTSATSGLPGSLKVFPLIEAASGTIRVVLINKDGARAGTVALRLPANGRSPNSLPAATVTRMVAQGSSPLNAKDADAITLGGTWLDVGGVQRGTPATESVRPVAAAGGGGGNGSGEAAWRVYMPPGSAAIVSIPRF